MQTKIKSNRKYSKDTYLKYCDSNMADEYSSLNESYYNDFCYIDFMSVNISHGKISLSLS